MLNLQKNYLQKYAQIYPENNQWPLIQYKLQLTLGNSAAYLKKIYCISTPFATQQFQRQNKSQIISETYIRPQQLIQINNRIERVCQKGFEFPNNGNGLLFTIGNIQLDPKLKQEHQLLLVKVCPRRAYPYLSKNQNCQDFITCPKGFDSIYYASEQHKNLYRHRFRLYNKMQTLPTYVIQFGFSQDKQNKMKEIICFNCQDQAAKVFCVTQNVYFCKKCDYEHHKNKISGSHQRLPLQDKPILDFGFCHNHKNNKNQLFCKTCNISMCLSCKIYGDHSEGFMASHQLIKITDYYEGISKKIDEIDPHLSKRKDQLEQLLAYTDQRIGLINKTASQIQAELNKVLEQALQNLRQIVHRKMSYLIADQLQIRRQYDYVQWMQSFIRYEYQILHPHEFLIAWTKHAKLRKQVLNLSNIPSITDVKANISLKSSVRIYEGDKRIGRKKSNEQELNEQDQYTSQINSPVQINKRKSEQNQLAQSNEKNNTPLRKKLFQQKF